MHFPLPTGEMISHPALVAALAKPGADILATLTPEKADAWHMASCIPGEVGELFAPIADTVFSHLALDRDNLVEELGDIEFYVQGVRAITGISYEETAATPALGADIKRIILSLPSAAADVFDAVKRWVIYNKALDRHALVCALTDLEYALEAVRIRFNTTRDETLAGNVMKLGTRYSGGYSDAAAQARADKSGTVH